MYLIILLDSGRHPAFGHCLQHFLVLALFSFGAVFLECQRLGFLSAL